jgi:hypothetical protein
MEQVYYTQCPMGYGLGAAGGFQLKRISRGYPRDADFRHLGFRVQMAGLAVASPRVLRYRLDGDVAEVACLTPRAREFEVAAGDGSATRQYGRPGGLFAHGLRLTPGELAALDFWPAGLLGWPLWAERDGRPTAGRFLEPIEWTPEVAGARPRPPRFEHVAPLAARWGRTFLARLLASTAEAARLGRSLFLIDAPAPPGRTGGVDELIALLTFAFPPSLRRELTFTTAHDRPEGLPGFRLIGLPASIRPERPALRALGRVADLGASSIEPRDEPPPWADCLAGWLVEGDRGPWEAACLDLYERVQRTVAPPERWADVWLNALMLFPERNGLAPTVLAGKVGRRELLEEVRWAAASGLSADWAASHPPAWWREAARHAGGSATACAILLQQGRWPESWSAPDPAAAASVAEGWGEAVALALGDRPESDWGEALRAFLSGAPPASRYRFVRALLRHAPSRAGSTLGWIRANGGLDRDRLRLLEALRHVAPDLDVEPLAAVLAESVASAADGSAPEGLTRLLRAVAQELAHRPGDWPALGSSLAQALRLARARLPAAEFERGRLQLLAWALASPLAPDLIAAHVRDVTGDPGGVAELARLRDALPPPARPALVGAALDSTSADPSRREAFVGVVETLHVPSWAEGPVPETRWAEPYLVAFKSDKPLITRLAIPGRVPRLLDWLDISSRLGELGPAAGRRLRRAQSFLAVLATSNATGLAGLELPEVEPKERGWLLGTLLGTVGRSSLDAALACLDACRRSWPANSWEKSDEVAQKLAESLAHLAVTPGSSALDFDAWRGSLNRFLDVLGAAPDPALRFGPQGLAARIVAATARLDAMKLESWPYRRNVLRDDELATTLAADISRSFQEAVDDSAHAVFRVWDTNLEVGIHRGRFLEIFLNACGDSAFIDLIPGLAEGLKTLGALRWWRSPEVDGAHDDLRDRFARTLPVRPLSFSDVMSTLQWLEPDEAPFKFESDLPPAWPSTEGRRLTGLSPLGQARWLSIEALSGILSAQWVKWAHILSRVRSMPVARLAKADRERIGAWLLYRAEPEPSEGPEPANVASVFRGIGLGEWSWLVGWPAQLPEDEVKDLENRVKTRAGFVEAVAARLRGG